MTSPRAKRRGESGRKRSAAVCLCSCFAQSYACALLAVAPYSCVALNLAPWPAWPALVCPRAGLPSAAAVSAFCLHSLIGFRSAGLSTARARRVGRWATRRCALALVLRGGAGLSRPVGGDNPSSCPAAPFPAPSPPGAGSLARFRELLLFVLLAGVPGLRSRRALNRP